MTRPYRARTVPPINLTNSSRLESLVRAGNLYLSAQDVVALAIENNLDVEIQRYGPLLAQEVLRRAQAGGALRSVGLGVAQGPQSVSLQGVSVNFIGVANGAGGKRCEFGRRHRHSIGTGAAFARSDGQFVCEFPTRYFPQSNTVLTGTTALTQDTRSFQAQYIQNWAFGMTAQLTYAARISQREQPVLQLNPFTSGDLDLQVTQNLLKGFGSAVNGVIYGSRRII